jgi:hypothetical protein
VQDAVGIASKAALFGSSATVCVGPPLSFNPPESRPVGVLFWSVGSENPELQLVSSEKL